MPDLNWFQEARYGMFLHWGLYAIPGGHWDGVKSPFGTEWIMRNLKIPLVDYQKLAARFNPTHFDAKKWVEEAKACGMKYMVLTAKHHDGFCLFDTAVSDYSITKATPFGRDIVAELADACRAEDMRFGLYYSQYQDWEDPDADGNTWDFPDVSAKNFNRYFQRKVKPQLEELLTNYGDICMIWFDTPYEMQQQYCKELVSLVRRLQPECLINGRVGYGLGDYRQMSDNCIPISRYPTAWETPMTLNDTWGFSKTDENWKSSDRVMKMLVDITQRGGNLLINVGPDELGDFPKSGNDILHMVGDWLQINGSSIYGTQAAPDFPYLMPWGGITRKGNTLYMHIMEWPSFPHEICVVGLKTKATNAFFMQDKSRVTLLQSYETARDEYRLRIQLPAEKKDVLNTVVAVELAGEAEIHSLR